MRSEWHPAAVFRIAPSSRVKQRTGSGPASYSVVLGFKLRPAVLQPQRNLTSAQSKHGRSDPPSADLVQISWGEETCRSTIRSRTTVCFYRMACKEMRKL